MDAPVLFPDMMTNMWSAVNRVTRSGDTLGEHHRISAYKNFEEQEKGTIKDGKTIYQNENI
ncbi:exoenzyme regulatory protein AepA [Vibrio sp. N418]|nr:exoenzyme regulatory protein AepA [Vibrio sp. N418]